MFQRLTINRQDLAGGAIDLGFLAECLVFYEKVRVIADAGTFSYLVRCCGPDELLDLLAMGALEIEFFENLTAVGTVQTNIGPAHELVVADTESLRYLHVSRKLFDELAGPSGKGANKLFNRFERVVDRSRYTTGMLQESHADLLDCPYATMAIKSLLSCLAPNYTLPDPLVFRVDTILKGGTYKVTTNVDFDAANTSKGQRGSDEPILNVAYLLSHIADTRRDLIVGSRLQSEFAVAPARAVVAACKFAELMSTAAKGVQVADAFQETVVDDVPSIREAVNSGKRNFRDVVHLVQKSEQFKAWLQKQGGTEDLRNAYCKEVGHLDWADKLPPKSMRWLLITGAGIVLGATAGPVAGTIAATALSAGDTFLLDKLIKGWKPNQFIEGPLKQFLRVE